MYTVYQSVSRIPLPTSLTLGFPPGKVCGTGNPSPTAWEMAIWRTANGRPYRGRE